MYGHMQNSVKKIKVNKSGTIFLLNNARHQKQRQARSLCARARLAFFTRRWDVSSAIDDSQIAETNEDVRDPREAQYCNIAPDWQHTNRRYRIGAYYIDPLRGQDQIQAKRCHWTPTHINGIGYSLSHYHLRSTGFRLRFTVGKPLSISLHMYEHMYLQGTHILSRR